MNNSVIDPSWNPNHTLFVKPIHFNASNDKAKDNQETFVVEEKQMDESFRKCLSYYHMYKEKYDEESDDDLLQIKTKCTFNTFLTCQCKWIGLNKTDELNFNITITKFNESCIGKETSRNNLKEIKLNLQCTVEGLGDGGWKVGYGFNQPVVITVEDSPKETVTLESASSINTLIAACAFLVVATPIVLFLYNKHKKRKKQESFEPSLVKLTEYHGVKMIDNPDYSLSSCESVLSKIEPILPEWLRNKKDMIFDTGCITKGNKLGHGHFGAVFEGKIRLGNAVYVFILYESIIYILVVIIYVYKQN